MGPSLEHLTQTELRRHFDEVADHVVSHVRGRFHSLVGIFVHGSVARGEPGPFSDIDLVVVTRGRKPSEFSYVEEDSYVGVGFQSLRDLEREFQNPKTFFWARGSATTVRILYDPKRILQRSFARWKKKEPSHELLEKGLWEIYHNLVEYSGKLRNGRVRHDEFVMRHSARIIAQYAESAIIALNNISVVSENYVWYQVLHAKNRPRHLRTDYPLALGVKGTSDTSRVYRAALRLCMETMIQIRQAFGRDARHEQFRALLSVPLEAFGLR